METYDQEMKLFVLGVAALYVLVALLPALYATFLALRTRPVLPRRLLFVGVVSLMSYGALVLLFLLVGMPIQLYMVYVESRLTELSHVDGSWQLALYNVMTSWGLLTLLIVIAVFSVILARYLVRRWDRVVRALNERAA